MEVDKSPPAARFCSKEAPPTSQGSHSSIRSADSRHVDLIASAPEPPTSNLDTKHRPPLDVVVISGLPDSRLNGVVSSVANPRNHVLDAQLDTERSNVGFVGDHTRGLSQGMVSSIMRTNPTLRQIQGGKSFKLKPRNLVPATNSHSPSRSSYSAEGLVGRKRRAYSMNSTQTNTTKSSGGTPPRSLPRVPMNNDGKKEVPDGSVPSNAMEGSLCTLVNESLSPLQVAKVEPISLQGLSLHSPSSQQAPSNDSTNSGSQRYAQHRADSSFTAYSESPARSLYMAGNSSTSESAVKFRTPSSSTRSSPRQVPLTVISHARSGSSSAKGIPRPLNLGISSMLQSLDRRKDSSSHSSHSTAGSSLSSDEGASKREHVPCLSLQTSSKKHVASLSPRTPLPKISLTPRTPHSRNTNKGIPIFPSPLGSGSDDEAFESGLTQPTHTYYTADRDAIGETMDSLLLGFTEKSCNDVSPRVNQDCLLDKPTALKIPVWGHESSNSLAFSADGSKDGKSSPVAHLHNVHSRDFLAPETPGMKKPAKLRKKPVRSKSSSIPSNDGYIEHKSNVSLRGSEAEIGTFGINATSLLRPSGFSDSQHVMLESTKCVQHDVETDSLSTSDDDFVLADPAAIAEEKIVAENPHSPGQVTSRRVKQKLTLGLKPTYTGPRQHQRAGSLSSGPRELFPSSTVDSASPQPLSSRSFSPAQDPSCASASNASLFGMDIVHEEGFSVSSSFPSAGRLNGSGSLNALRRRSSDEAFGSSGSLCRRRSEHSLGSLGLPLDDIGAPHEDSGRDLVTPPIIMRNKALSPPPLAPRHE